ncbi:holin [Paenibacillus sp. FSL R5-0887]|uniref:holin n=1 Tax=Paenibacillus sp. FSL R5-0887 TaxID=2921662 RepID=UPI0030F6CEE6
MDNENLTNVLAFASVIAVFVLAGVQFVKKTFNVQNNLLPVIGLVIGLLIGVVAYPFTDLSLRLRLWSGGLAGLSATGFFELAFNKREGNTKD